MYKLVWDDFCSFFLEMIKPPFGSPISSKVLSATLELFDELLRFTHPFMPFISEEIWQELKERKAGESICISPYPSGKEVDTQLLDQIQVLVDEMLIPIRNYRNSNQISPKTPLTGLTISSKYNWAKAYFPMVEKLGNVADYQFSETLSGQIFAGKRLEWSLPKEEKEISDSDRQKLLEELEYTKGFLSQVNQKLENDRFVANAKPEMVEKERQKKADAEAKIASLENVLG
jgi:valyl-tRNA synthetase